MVGIITTPESEIEQKREVKLTDGNGVPIQGTTAGGFSEVVAEFVVPSEQRSGVGVTVPLQMVQQLYPWGKGTVVNYVTSTTNDSDVSITVPDGKIWEVFRIFAELNCSADVGNRTLWITVVDSVAAKIWQMVKSGNTTATQMVIAEVFNLATYSTTTTQFASSLGTNPHVGIRFPLPLHFYLKEGSVIRIYDSAAIAPLADDFGLIVVDYVEYDA